MSNGQMVVKKDKTSSSLPIMRAHVDLTVKTTGSKKRKNVNPADLSLENLRVEDALRKLIFFSQAISTNIILLLTFLLLLILMFFFVTGL